MNKDVSYLLVGIFLLILIVIIQTKNKKESFNFNKFDKLRKRPTYADSKTGYISNPNIKKTIIKTTDKSVSEEDVKNKFTIPKTTNETLQEKIFKTTEHFIFDNGTKLEFNMPHTTVPNDQGKFADWLYGSESVCKDGSMYTRRSDDPEQVKECKEFKLTTPVNFFNSEE